FRGRAARRPRERASGASCGPRVRRGPPRARGRGVPPRRRAARSLPAHRRAAPGRALRRSRLRDRRRPVPSLSRLERARRGDRAHPSGGGHASRLPAQRAGSRARAARPARAGPRLPALAREKLAEDVVILDMRPECSFTDYFVIATGRNPRQTASIWDEVHTRLKQDERLLPQSVDGAREGAWIVADYIDVVLHVFTPDAR